MSCRRSVQHSCDLAYLFGATDLLLLILLSLLADSRSTLQHGNLRNAKCENSKGYFANTGPYTVLPDNSIFTPCSHCKRCISYGNSVRLSVRPSVCLSVTRLYCVKTTARSTMQFAPLDSKMCLVCRNLKIFPENESSRERKFLELSFLGNESSP